MLRAREDVLVIGAGAAGLSAARDLSLAGCRVTLIEARNRLGGRVHTVHDPLSPLPIELGAEFIHGQSESTFEIVRAARLQADEIPEGHYVSREGHLEQATGFWERIEESTEVLRRALRRNPGTDCSFAEYLERAGVDGERGRELREFIEGFQAAHLDKISARSLAVETDETSSHQFRLPGGNDGLIQSLARSLDPERVTLRLNTIARRLRWSRGAVTLSADSATGRPLDDFRARSAVVALPHALLREGRLEFEPALADKQRAAALLEVGQVFKIVLRFRESFWEDEDFLRSRMKKSPDELPGLAFLHTRENDVPVWWTSLPSRSPLFTGWAGGPRAERLLALEERERIDRSLESLSKGLSMPRGVLDDRLESWSSHDWKSDPFSGGAYTYVGVGGVPALQAMARPVEGTLFFAGEYTELEEIGTVSGAISSGRKAARALLQARPSARRPRR
ncbi:MAG: FAD-dependent oxidoreductase [Planctomycetaceae bacterium]|nr:FAD-dependent oxidoreductase [Planctomycetaceae bacterium]